VLAVLLLILSPYTTVNAEPKSDKHGSASTQIAPSSDTQQHASAKPALLLLYKVLLIDVGLPRKLPA
jgi:hypothetical protein